MLKLYYFSASWCQPCKQYGPIVERVCEQTGVELVKVDISTEEGESLAAEEGVRGVPTIQIDRYNERVYMRQGTLSKEGLRSLIGSFGT